MRRSKHGGVYVYRTKRGWKIFFRDEGKLTSTKAFPTEALALAEAAILRAELVGKSHTIRTAWDAYVAAKKATGRRDKTIKAINDDMERLFSCPVRADVWDEPLSVLTERRAEALYQDMATRFAPGTARRTLITANAFGTWCSAKKRAWLRYNPWAEVKFEGKVPSHRDESLRRDEARDLRARLLAASDDDGATCVLLVLCVSLSPHEVIQLCARDVDDGGRVLWVGGVLKTENRRRQLEIHDDELRARLVEIADRKDASDLLWPHHVSWVTRQVRRFVPGGNARLLRRTFAALDARRGSSLDALAFGMGHGADAGASTARQYYVSKGSIESGRGARVANELASRAARADAPASPTSKRLAARSPRVAARR